MPSAMRIAIISVFVDEIISTIETDKIEGIFKQREDDLGDGDASTSASSADQDPETAAVATRTSWLPKWRP